MLLLTGDTYPIRHEIKSTFNAKWDKGENGWLIDDSRRAELVDFANSHNLEISETETEIKELTPDELREYRQQKINRLAEKKLKKANGLLKQVDEIDKQLEPYSDWSFITQPLMPGHHSYKKHKNLRERIGKKMDKQMVSYIEAKELQQSAEYLKNTKARVKGDAAKEKEIERQSQLALISIGDTVEGLFKGRCTGIVTKINKNTIRFVDNTGYEYKDDIRYVTLVSKATNE